MHVLAVLSIIFCFQVVLGSFSSWYTWLYPRLPMIIVGTRAGQYFF